MRICTLFRLILVISFAGMIAACGFHLRGNIPLSDGIKNMYVKGAESNFKTLLEERLTALGADLAGNQKAAKVVLDVTNIAHDRSVGTLDERGKANSYNVELAVTYRLLDKSGKQIRSSTTVRESRRYNFDPLAVVESESEEAELRQNMEQEAVLKVVRQLASITDADLAANTQK